MLLPPFTFRHATEFVIQLQELLFVRLCRLVAAAHQFSDGFRIKIQHIDTRHVGIDIDAALASVFFQPAVGHDAQVLLQLPSDGAQVVGFGRQFRCHFQTDDDVGTHLTAHIHGEVVGDAPVGQQVVIPLHRREENGYRHARTDGTSELTATQYLGFAGHQVGSHAGKGYRHRVETYGVLVAHAQTVEQIEQIVAFDGTQRHGRHDGIVLAGVLAIGDIQQQLIAHLASALREVAAFHLASDIERPVDFGDECFHLLGAVAQGIETAEDGAHACSRDVAHGNANLFHVLQHANVCRSFGATAAQHDAHLGASLVLRTETRSLQHEQRAGEEKQYWLYQSMGFLHILRFNS